LNHDGKERFPYTFPLGPGSRPTPPPPRRPSHFFRLFLPCARVSTNSIFVIFGFVGRVVYPLRSAVWSMCVFPVFFPRTLKFTCAFRVVFPFSFSRPNLPSPNFFLPSIAVVSFFFFYILSSLTNIESLPPSGSPVQKPCSPFPPLFRSGVYYVLVTPPFPYLSFAVFFFLPGQVPSVCCFFSLRFFLPSRSRRLCRSFVFVCSGSPALAVAEVCLFSYFCEAVSPPPLSVLVPWLRPL